MAHSSLWNAPKPTFGAIGSEHARHHPQHHSLSSSTDCSPKPNHPVSGWYLASDPRSSSNSSSSLHSSSKVQEIMSASTDLTASPETASLQLDFANRFKCLKGLEIAKNELIQDLLYRVELLTSQTNQLKEELENERDYSRSVQRRNEAYHETIHLLNAQLECDPFTLVLIDGMTLLFQNNVVQQGYAGGIYAAANLYEAVHDYVDQHLFELSADHRIVIRVYADISELAEVCFNAGITNKISTVHDFVNGFSQGNSLFDFIDTGHGEYPSITKLLATFKLHIHDPRCKQVILGCSYADEMGDLLNKLGAERKFLQRTTLLQGAPVEKDLKAPSFRMIKFDTLFQDFSEVELPTDRSMRSATMSPMAACGSPSSPNLNRQLSFMSLKSIQVLNSNTPRQARATSISTDCSPKPSPTIAWASIAAKAAQTPVPMTRIEVPISPSLHNPQIPRNRKGQRIDPIIKHDKVEVDRVKKLKMCNVHYLRNECPYGDACTHIHSYKPTTQELQTLRLVARMAPCMHGSDCDDVKCVYGHICPAPEGRDGKDCIFGDQCRFPAELHKIDRQIVKIIRI